MTAAYSSKKVSISPHVKMEYVVDPGKRSWVSGLMTLWSWLCDPNPNTGYSLPPNFVPLLTFRAVPREPSSVPPETRSAGESCVSAVFLGPSSTRQFPVQRNGEALHRITSYKEKLLLMCFPYVRLKRVKLTATALVILMAPFERVAACLPAVWSTADPPHPPALSWGSSELRTSCSHLS